MARKALIHVGTHKTGTKTIQAALVVNSGRLRNEGIYIPRAGQVDFGEGRHSPGHHELASDDPRAALSSLEAELRAAQAPNVIISSEEFYPRLGTPQTLTGLRDLLNRLGYACVTVIYLRDQAELAESMYAEIFKTLKRPLLFSEYLDEIFTHGARYPGRPYTLIFEYSQAISRFAEIFGPSNIVVRPFREGQDSLQDFLATVAVVFGLPAPPAMPLEATRLNRRESIGDVLKRFQSDLHEILGVAADSELLDEPFAPMLVTEIARMHDRFAYDNSIVEQMAHFHFSNGRASESPKRHRTWQREMLDRACKAFS